MEECQRWKHRRIDKLCWFRYLLTVLIISLQLSCCHALTSFATGATSNRNCDRNFPKCNIHILFASTSPLPSFTINDSEKELESIRSWKSTSAKAKEAEVVYRAQSALDDNAFVEVKKRINGWHTLGVVGGPTKSIYHGVFRKDETNGLVDPYALGPSEYIRTMASVAMCLSAVNAHDAKKNSSGDHNPDNLSETQQENSHAEYPTQSTITIFPTPLSFLHMGYGSGSLMRFLRRAIPESQHLAIDLDPTVVEAAVDLGLVDPISSCETLVVGDALEYPCLETKKTDESNRFHGVCIDVFDGANLMPPGFYAVPFLEKLRDNLLATDGCAFVIHNFHVGTERLETQLEDAMESYRTVFGTTSAKGAENEDGTTQTIPQHTLLQHSLYRVDSLNTNNHGGNTILIAIAKNFGDDVVSTNNSNWLELVALAMKGWEEKRFDLSSRIEHVRPF